MKKRKQRNLENWQSYKSSLITPVPPKLTVPVKEMKMNKMEFGETIFGGNLKKNLKIEANLNRTVVREKFN